MNFRGSPCFAVAVGLVLATLSTQPMAQDPNADGQTGGGNPSCVDIVSICQNFVVANEMEISDVTTNGAQKCDGDECTQTELNTSLNTSFTAIWTVNQNGSVGLPSIADAGEFTLAALIAEGKQDSNAYCSPTAGGEYYAPGKVKGEPAIPGVTPTKVTFCWAEPPSCPDPVAAGTACELFSDGDGNSSIQAVRVDPQDNPTNICGCNNAVANFCNLAAGECPVGGTVDPFEALAAQSTAIVGTNTCQLFNMGGGYFIRYDPATGQYC